MEYVGKRHHSSVRKEVFLVKMWRIIYLNLQLTPDYPRIWGRGTGDNRFCG